MNTTRTHAQQAHLERVYASEAFREMRRIRRRRQYWAGMGWLLLAAALLAGPMLYAEWLLP